MINRRESIKLAAIATAAVAVAPRALAQSVVDGRFEPLFKLPPLPYAFDALEPHIDARTMEIHHDKHHAAYVGNLNNALSQVPDLYFETKQKGATEQTVGDLLKNLSSVPEKIRTAIKNNGGGHYNHSLFWQLMKKGGSKPKGELADAIKTGFGTFASFRDQFSKAALRQFGSGWAWLTLDSGVLKIESMPNQDSPLSSGRPAVLGLDVWEHAYYLKYQNERAEYISAWFDVINWDFAADRYRALKG